MALAMISPIPASPLAEMVATCATCSFSLTSCFISSSLATMASTALSIPRFRHMGLAPAVTFFRPCLKMASARTVAVVVPSPAMSLVLDATSRTICAPIFWNGLASSTSFATLTPSLVMVGEPNFLSRTTFLPRGPRVALTAAESCSTPERSWRLASSLKSSCLAGIVYFSKFCCCCVDYAMTARMSELFRILYS